MERWNSLSYDQKSQIVGAALGACLALITGVGSGPAARAIAVLIGALLGWGLARLVASVRPRK